MPVAECRKKVTLREAHGWIAYFKEQSNREIEERKTNSLTDYYLMQNTMELRLLRSQWSKKKVKVKFNDFLLKFNDDKKEDNEPETSEAITKKYASRLKTSMPDIEKWQQSLIK